MANEIILRLINVGLRGSTLVCKFVLVFFLAKYLEPVEVGLYGLLVVTIGYSFFLVGIEFYTFASRELIGCDTREWLPIMKNQWAFFFLSYAFFLPISWLFFYSGFLPIKYYGWFFLLFILEHTAQEFNRLLVAMGRQFLASIILFLRSGVWAIFAVFAMWVYPQSRNLEFLFTAWAIGVGAACLLGGLYFRKLDRSRLLQRIDWQWILRGIKISLPLLVASLAIRGIFTFDRYWVEAVAGLDTLGAYVLFAGIAFSIISFLDAGVIAFLYPRVVAAAKDRDDSKFRMLMKELSKHVMFATALMSMVALVVSPYILAWIEKPIYLESIELLRWLLLSVVLYSLSMIPHVGLYAMHKDSVISHSQVTGMLVFVVGCIIGVPWLGVMAVILAMCLAFTVILIWKLYAFKVLCAKKLTSVGADSEDL